MPRTYVRTPGSRRYGDYTPEQMQTCLAAIKRGEITQRRAEVEYKIPRRTIINKLKEKHTKKPGHQPIFTPEEENQFANCIISLSNFGFPVDCFELRQIIKQYLNRCGRTVRAFNNNTPARDWTRNFLKRNPILSERFAENIKRNRASINIETIQNFISNLEEELRNVPETHIWNFDETNITDNPGQAKVIVKKGCKYPEKIRNASKTSISLMFAGSAAGELLPPYVVYKSNHMWSTWTENGPLGCRYNNSASGWFDASVFTDWFESQMLPRLKKLDGKKVLLCDNLSSHITVSTLKLCRENAISLVCLPPNSTHLTQPLDVAFFRPMKIAWRKVLSEWKETADGVRNTNIQKQHFPPLLKKMLTIMGPNIAENLRAGFKKCGIVPLNPEPLLARLPGGQPIPPDVQQDIQVSFLETLEKRRAECTNPIKTRRKKINIPAGKSVCDAVTAEESDPQESESEENISASKKRPFPDLNDNSSDDYDPQSEATEMDKENEFIADNCALASGSKDLKDLLNLPDVVREVGKYVLFSYEDDVYPGQITGFNDCEVTINSMHKSMKSWKWPEKKDELNYPWEDVLGCIKPPQKVSRRGVYTVPELNQKWWT